MTCTYDNIMMSIETLLSYEEEQLRGGRRYDDEEEEEYVREGTYEGKSFPPKPSDWREIPANTIPSIVSFDMAKGQFWDHGQTDIKFFVEIIAQLKELYGHDDDRESVVALLCDRDSALYQACLEEYIPCSARETPLK